MIIVTGSSGFVGSNLRSYLEKKSEKILGVSRTPSEYEVDYKKINTTLLNTTNSFVHLAGKAHDLKKTSDEAEYFKVNTELSKKLFNQFLESTCEVFIYMSSVKAAADSVKEILTEQKIPNPMTSYGKSKLAAENYILSKKISNDKRVYILRPCMIHGPGNKGNLNLLYKLVQTGIPYPLGIYKNKRSFLSIENLCFVIRELILKRPESGIFNVADDTPISTNNLIKIIAKTMGKKSKIWCVPKIIVNVFAKIGSIFKLPFNKDNLQKLTENYIVSNSKIKETLNVEFPVSTISGFTNTIKSFEDI